MLWPPHAAKLTPGQQHRAPLVRCHSDNEGQGALLLFDLLVFYSLMWCWWGPSDEDCLHLTMKTFNLHRCFDLCISRENSFHKTFFCSYFYFWESLWCSNTSYFYPAEEVFTGAGELSAMMNLLRIEAQWHVVSDVAEREMFASPDDTFVFSLSSCLFA